MRRRRRAEAFESRCGPARYFRIVSQQDPRRYKARCAFRWHVQTGSAPLGQEHGPDRADYRRGTGNQSIVRVQFRWLRPAMPVLSAELVVRPFCSDPRSARTATLWKQGIDLRCSPPFPLQVAIRTSRCSLSLRFLVAPG